jgi:hypothetical protein
MIVYQHIKLNIFIVLLSFCLFIRDIKYISYSIELNEVINTFSFILLIVCAYNRYNTKYNLDELIHFVFLFFEMFKYYINSNNILKIKERIIYEILHILSIFLFVIMEYKTLNFIENYLIVEFILNLLNLFIQYNDVYLKLFMFIFLQL